MKSHILTQLHHQTFFPFAAGLINFISEDDVPENQGPLRIGTLQRGMNCLI